MSYWKDRSEALEGLVDRRCQITGEEISKLYDSALDRLDNDIKKIFASYVKGYGVTPEQAQNLLSRTQTQASRKKLLAMLEKLEAENADPAAIQALRSVLDAPAYAFRISKLEALRAEAYADIAAIGLEESRYHAARLADLYKESYYRTSFDLSQSVGYNVPFEKLSNRQVSAAVEAYWSPGINKAAQNYSSRVWGNTQELAEDVREVMTRGLLTGQSYTEMIQELTRLIGSAEYRKKLQPDRSTRTILTGSGAKYKAARLIRTEGNYISGQARMAAYRDAGIERYIYRAYLEMRTCRRCGELDGQVFAVAEQRPGVNLHPLHPHCFCFTEPYQPREDLHRQHRAAQTGVKDLEGGRFTGELVPADMTYTQWREKYVDGNSDMEEAEKNRRELRRGKNSGKEKSEQKASIPRKSEKIPEPVHVVPKRWLDYLAEQDQSGK